MGKALVIQLARMGDIAQSLHLGRDLKVAEGHSVFMLVDQRLGDLVWKLAPWLDGVFTLDVEGYLRGFRNNANWVSLWEALDGETGPIARERFDRVVNLNYGRLAGTVASVISGDVQVEGFHSSARGSCGDAWTDFFSGILQANRRWNRFHLVDVFRSYASTRGLEPERSGPEATGWRGPGVLGIQLGTRCAKRTWPAEAFVEVVLGFKAWQGADILLLGEEGERKTAQYVLDRAGGPHVHDLVGRTSLSDLVDVLSGVDVLLSGDTGTLHLASWLGVRSVGIFFGPAYAFETGPYGAGHTVIQVEKGCSPCKETERCTERVCGETLTAEAVLCVFRGEAFRLRPPLYAYRSEFRAGWLQYLPVENRVASWEEILAFLYWGSAGQFLDALPGRFPSMELAIRCLRSSYRVGDLGEMQEKGFWDDKVPGGLAEPERRRLQSILQDGWNRLKEQIHGDSFEEFTRIERESAGAGCPS